MKDLITIVGPTASGKTALAVAVARRLGGEIISADSRQVYRGMDIGTGKDLAEYGDTPYHLIDICAAGEKYNLYRYMDDCRHVLTALQQRDVYPILCGGTGLYVESILKGYALQPVPANEALRAALADKTLPELTALLARLRRAHGTVPHNLTAYSTPSRAIRAIEIELAHGTARGGTQESTPPATPSLRAAPQHVFCINLPREQRRTRITQRLVARLQQGMIEEVQRLLRSGIPAADLIYYGLEYKYVTEYCLGHYSREEMFRLLETAIHRFAKRQMTWFRGMERRGIPVHWLDVDMPMEEKVEEIICDINKKS